MSENNENINNEAEGGEKKRCRFCGRLNKIKTQPTKGGIRCGSCRLPLSDQPHKKWSTLDPDTYIHPLDRQALQALRKIPGIDTLLRKLLEVTHERYSRVLF